MMVAVRVYEAAHMRSARNATASASRQLAGLMAEQTDLRVQDVAEVFRMSGRHMAETLGLPLEGSQESKRGHGQNPQTRMREMLEIIQLLQDWAGGVVQAMAWYRSEPIPSFGGRTAEALVKSGSAPAVREYIQHLATGGFA